MTSLSIDERAIPVGRVVRAACEMLGLDPLYVANEGRFVAIVRAADADLAVEVLRTVGVSRGAVIAGRVTDGDPGLVMLQSRAGDQRVLDMLSGEQLPRIC